MNTLRVLMLLALVTLTGTVRAADDDSPDPEHIYNYHAVSADLATAGQLFPVQVPKLESENYGLVINLAVADEARNFEESFHVTRAGISYVQIPVAWAAPTKKELALFFAVMDAREGRKTLVHCFANYRASAFTYLYRVIREGVPEVQARKDLFAIWDEAAFEEYPQWRAFIDGALADAGISRE